MGLHKERMVLEKTLKVYIGVVVAIFLVLVLRLSWLQLYETESYRTEAVTNTLRLIPETAPRGEIIDTNGQVIATNRPVFNLTLDYLGLQDTDMDQVIDNLVEILADPEITHDSINAAVKSKSSRLYEPIVIKRDIPIELVTIIEERSRNLPGVSITTQPQRYYNFGTLAGHLLGYVHSIKEELEQPGFEDYGMNDLVGKTGVEKTYEHSLRGEDGFRQMEVTAKNRPVREVSAVPAVPGNSVVLTIDMKLQEVMEESFDETLLKLQEKFPKAQAGAAVLLDVNTGQVLAMTSRPSMNPDDFNGHALNQAQADYYFRNTPPALYNRAIQGSYVPGSTFKPITGMAALLSGNLDLNDTVVCNGAYWNAPYIKCWGVHGRVNFYSGMAHSCNVYFQEAARRATIAQIGFVGNEFGIGSLTGIDLPFESTGLLPDSNWQAKEFAARAERINNAINDKITELETEYQEKISQAATDQEVRALQSELNSKKRVQEQQRNIELEHYTNWHDWDTYNIGIGQGYNQYTVIELANYVATLANGGTRYEPYTVQKILAPDGSVLEEFAPVAVHQVDLPADILTETRKAMVAVTAPGGTSYSLFKDFPAHIKVGAKTGTAQPGRVGYVKNKDFDGLYIAFAPADNPRVAFAGVIEYGNSGSGSVGLVARAVLEEYFGLKHTESTPESVAGDLPAPTE